MSHLTHPSPPISPGSSVTVSSFVQTDLTDTAVDGDLTATEVRIYNLMVQLLLLCDDTCYLSVSLRLSYSQIRMKI